MLATVSAILSKVLPWLLVVVVGYASFRLGRKWRKAYKEALDFAAELKATAAAYSALQAKVSARSEASGNRVSVYLDGGRVQVAEDDGSEHVGGDLGGAVRPGALARGDRREALSAGRAALPFARTVPADLAHVRAHEAARLGPSVWCPVDEVVCDLASCRGDLGPCSPVES